jgi:hypothetical protein
VGIARFAAHGVGVETCLLGLDGSDDVAAVVVAGLRARPWECVAFNSTPADTFDAAARWVDVPGPAGAS